MTSFFLVYQIINFEIIQEIILFLHNYLVSFAVMLSLLPLIKGGDFITKKKKDQKQS